MWFSWKCSLGAEILIFTIAVWTLLHFVTLLLCFLFWLYHFQFNWRHSHNIHVGSGVLVLRFLLHFLSDLVDIICFRFSFRSVQHKLLERCQLCPHTRRATSRPPACRGCWSRRRSWCSARRTWATRWGYDDDKDDNNDEDDGGDKVSAFSPFALIESILKLELMRREYHNSKIAHMFAT